MRLYVVRHADAGSRSSWDGPDEARPLTNRGRRQAAAITAELRAARVTRLVSSPYRRCVQTLDPLGQELRLPVESDDRLAEGAGGVAALALADELAKEPHAAVVCSHGDVIPELLRILKATTARFKDPFIWPKASMWAVTWDGERWAKARYIAPPADGDAW
ncbi:MAG TPA: phosphoglycerate mutase family protein [Acidimicrobiales bacterium]|nr:phosphoglycerate mutase family protein [Acidimicrobiales bacterium]